jgi:translation initiation factor IF-2
MVVAINKVDRAEADQERVKRQLAEHDLLIEEWGGDVIAVPVSALKGEGIPELLENILLVAEIGDLKANPNRPAKGVVVEAQIDKSRGPVATVLIQTGTLRVGVHVVAGEARGKIRAMLDNHDSRISEAGPSVPVSILGLSDLPQAGDIFEVASDEKTAREITERRIQEREKRRGTGVTLEQVHSRLESGKLGSLELIVKTDVQGTIGAIRGALLALSTEETRVNVIHAASGSITESDVLLAVASDAIIVGFNSTPEPGAETLARQEDVEIRHYDVIYNLIDDIRAALKGMLAPTVRDIVEGIATVRAVFNVGRRQKAAGIYVNRGRISRGAGIHVLRGNKRIFTGQIISLKHFKDDVREIGTGAEGGLALEGYSDYQEGDIIEGHITEVVT